MSTKDNSYSQITKRLRSKYNAAFFQNNSSGQVNIFSGGVGNTTNGWINSLVTGRKDVISTSDQGFRNVDDSCVCGAAPTPAPEPLSPQAIRLMRIGSTYAVTQEAGIFKATNVDGQLTKNYLQNFSGDIFTPYILSVDETYTYVVGHPTEITTSVVYVLDKLTGATVNTFSFLNTFVTGVTELAGTGYNNLYINYVTIDPITFAAISYISVYDLDNDLSEVNTFNMNTGFSGNQTVILGNLVSADTGFYAFAYNITGPGMAPGSITYNFSVIRFANSDLSDATPSIHTIVTGAEIVFLSLLENLQSIAIFEPCVYELASVDWIAVPQIFSDGFKAYRVRYDTGTSTFSDDEYMIDASITTTTLVPLSSIAAIPSSYLICSAGSATTGNKIYCIPQDFDPMTTYSPSDLSYLDASDYRITSDGTAIYTWFKNESDEFYIYKYNDPTTLATPIVSQLYNNVLPTISLNIGYDPNANELFANFTDGNISQINTTTLEPTGNDVIII
jgi:hypothetical protein